MESAVAALPPAPPTIFFPPDATGDVIGLRGKSATESGVLGSPPAPAPPPPPPPPPVAAPPALAVAEDAGGAEAVRSPSDVLPSFLGSRDAVSREDIVEVVDMEETEPADVNRRTTEGHICVVCSVEVGRVGTGFLGDSVPG